MRVLHLHHHPFVNNDNDRKQAWLATRNIVNSTPTPVLPHRSRTFQLSTRVILGMVEEIKAGKEPSPLPTNLVDSFRATLTQKVH